MRGSWLGAAFLVQMAPGVATWGLDLPLVFTALTAVRCRLLEALAWGCAAGLLQDLLSACGPGPHLSAKAAAAVAAWLSQRLVFRERVLTQAALVAVCMVVQQAWLGVLFGWLGETSPDSGLLEGVLGPTLATTLAGAAASWVLVLNRRRRLDPPTA
jgi:rod shape-determining protein MreD